ncbi:MAG: hypothetical protein HY220_03690 [Candidatus Sungbacteria bacterium]|uniref:Uncharacterized protein n=1 Tax=Candidatus Sungiibacteriota bacterium TaxID=2750080 RepID=A0A9D6LQK8_9BACT|nr:hypothetical protein [Candidatus Sungbacteria bacterium]
MQSQAIARIVSVIRRVLAEERGVSPSGISSATMIRADSPGVKTIERVWRALPGRGVPRTVRYKAPTVREFALECYREMEEVLSRG